VVGFTLSDKVCKRNRDVKEARHFSLECPSDSFPPRMAAMPSTTHPSAVIHDPMSAASEMLEIPGVRARVSPVTVEPYHQFPEFNVNGRRTELICGMVIEKGSKFLIGLVAGHR
jgi:hypothetical protein